MNTREDIPLGLTSDADGRALTYRDSDGYWSEYIRDQHGWILSYRNSAGFWREYTRDADGNVLSYRGNDNAESAE